MTVKIICAAVIVISCSYVGVKLAGALRLRVRMLTDMVAAVEQIESCIGTVRMPLSEIYATLSMTKGAAGEFFSKVKPGESWKKQLDILTGLTSRDKALLLDLSNKLGAYETERQLDEIRLAKVMLTDALSQAKSDMLENSKVYRAMSFFTGVVIAILLI